MIMQLIENLYVIRIIGILFKTLQYEFISNLTTESDFGEAFEINESIVRLPTTLGMPKLKRYFWII